MIEVLEGKGVGSGKSYTVIDWLLRHWTRGGTAYVSESFRVNWEACKAYALKRWGLELEDDQCHIVASDAIGMLHEHTAPGTAECPVLIVLDEAQDQLNARDWNDKNKRELFAWCCQSRHDDNDLLFVSQSAANIDKQIRRLATFTWSVRNARNFSIPGLGNVATGIRCLTLGLNDGFYFVRSQFDYDGRTLLGRNWVKADKGLFQCYESKSMRLTRKRAGAAIAKKRLKRQKGRHPMIKYVILGGIAAAVIAGWQLFHGHGFKVGATPKGQDSGHVVKTIPGATSKAETEPKPRYRLLTEPWTYSGGAVLRFKEAGTVIVGEVCKYGMVEAIKNHVARIREPNGGLLYLVGEDLDRSEKSASTVPAATPIPSGTPVIAGYHGLFDEGSNIKEGESKSKL